MKNKQIKNTESTCSEYSLKEEIFVVMVMNSFFFMVIALAPFIYDVYNINFYGKSLPALPISVILSLMQIAMCLFSILKNGVSDICNKGIKKDTEKMLRKYSGVIFIIDTILVLLLVLSIVVLIPLLSAKMGILLFCLPFSFSRCLASFVSYIMEFKF